MNTIATDELAKQASQIAAQKPLDFKEVLLRQKKMCEDRLEKVNRALAVLEREPDLKDTIELFLDLGYNAYNLGIH